ncbi:MAG: MerR family transcriptional regulator [Cyclobacteriaceae bacterium]
MSTYSIKDLEHLSGVKAHTLRIWEQRYNLFKPQRSETNIRSYSGEDLKLLLNVTLLKENGYKISHIAKMPHQLIMAEVAQISERNLKKDDQIAALTVAMLDLDELRFEKVISANILKRGLEQTMINVVFPFLERIGVLWMTGSIVPGQEHFISNLIRQKIIAAIDGQFIKYDPSATKFILYLPEGELHEMSLLFADYLIRSRGKRSIYLGQAVPLEDIKTVCAIHQPDYVLTIITSSPGGDDLAPYLTKLCNIIPDVKILASGHQVVNAAGNVPSNVQVLQRTDSLLNLIE